ncbi:MAG: IscA/HesB family protein [Proteobacteria bacterium]|nr:IscA/HesB family protein [Pseudomonadota bacterium]
MLIVTESAQVQVADYFKDKEIKPVRVMLTQGCGGTSIVMALDEKNDQDKVFKFSGIEYLVNRDFLKDAQPIEIDFRNGGFAIKSSIELSGGCSSCGTAGSCCSS